MKNLTKKLTVKSALAAMLVTGAFSTTTAQANQYYNCATESGCVPSHQRFDWGNDYTKTKYPLVLVHGFTGWTSAAGIDYYYGVGTTLMKTGTDTLFAPLVSGQNSSEVRGEQLLAQIEHMKAVSGKDKFNFVGHSHGAPTVRYVYAAKPEIFASITSVAGVIQGSKAAKDVLDARYNNKVTAIPMAIVEKIFEVIGGALGFFSSGQVLPQDLKASLTSLTESHAVTFNAKYPAGVPSTACGEGAYEENGVKFYSFAGNRVTTNNLDPLEWFFNAVSLSYKPTNTVSDSMMEPCKTHFGKVLRDDYPLNHMDLVNSVMGIRDYSQVNPLSIYLAHTNRLKNEGL